MLTRDVHITCLARLLALTRRLRRSLLQAIHPGNAAASAGTRAADPPAALRHLKKTTAAAAADHQDPPHAAVQFSKRPLLGDKKGEVSDRARGCARIM